ncbi:MAG: beta-1,6-N-acetylglucosaminyltransferase [Saprospiraceae bacterium]
MFINYVILAHHFPVQLKKLVNRLNDENVTFFIHIDVTSDIHEFKKLISHSNVIFIEKRENAIWGNFTMVQATLNGMNEVMKYGRGGFTILLSGQDYPLASNKHIKRFLSTHHNYNFIDIKSAQEAWPIEYKAKIQNYYLNLTPKRGNGFFIAYFLDIPFIFFLKTIFHLIKHGIRQKNLGLCLQVLKLFKKRNSPIPCHYGGSQWWAFNQETLKMILNYVEENPLFINFHRYTYIPDEIFFHTIIKLLADKYPEIKILPSLTYVNWEKLNYDFPAIFGTTDFDELKKAKKNGKLFARKFEAHIDAGILDLLDEAAYLSDEQ